MELMKPARQVFDVVDDAVHNDLLEFTGFGCSGVPLP
jgi:hypothetical protein